MNSYVLSQYFYLLLKITFQMDSCVAHCAFGNSVLKIAILVGRYFFLFTLNDASFAIKFELLHVTVHYFTMQLCMLIRETLLQLCA